jgi:large subunit ribosomal protein L25
MAQQTELAFSPRDAMGKAAKRLRKQGLIPANIYGHKEAPQAIQIDAVEFDTLRRARKIAGILTLRLGNDGATQTALVRQVKRDPVTGKIQHIDFLRMSLTERIEVKISLHFVGEAPAVKNEGGVLLHLLDALEVECTAQDIVDSIDVDVSSLAAIDDMIYAKDVQLPARYKLITDPEEPVAKVAATRAEAAEEAAEEKAEAAEAAGAPAAAPAEEAAAPASEE